MWRQRRAADGGERRSATPGRRQRRAAAPSRHVQAHHEPRRQRPCPAPLPAGERASPRLMRVQGQHSSPLRHTLPLPETVPVQFFFPPTSAFTHRTCALVAASDGATNCASRCLRPPSLQPAGASKAAAVTAGASAAACACMCPMPFAIILVAKCLTPRAQSRLQSRPCCCCQWLLLWRSFPMCVSPVHLWSAPASHACMPAL